MIAGVSLVRAIRPLSFTENGSAVVVNTNIFLRTIHEIDERNMKVGIQITLRGSWVDPRLAFKELSTKNDTAPEYVDIPADSSSDRKPWTPDTFFQTARYGIEDRRKNIGF